MQRLNTLWQIASAASQVAEMARASQHYHFTVGAATTFFLHCAHAEVRISRWEQPEIDVVAQLQAPFAWRVETDQDDAGVYFVARRRPVVGQIAGAVFDVHVPHDTYLVLKMEYGRISVGDINGTVELPPTLTKFVITPD
jgi:hypothetical protein